MKNSLFQKIITTFYNEKKYKFCFLFFFSLIASLFELCGLALIYQFILFLSSPNSNYSINIINFFKTNFNIENYSLITITLGILIALIYIFKNIYLLFFTKYNNNLFQDLSVTISKKIFKNILFQDYINSIKTTSIEKFNVLTKISTIVWEYCQRYIALLMNGAITLLLISFIFVKFTTCALMILGFMSILSLINYLILKKKSTLLDKKINQFLNASNKLTLNTLNSIKEIKLNNKQDEAFKQYEKNTKSLAKLSSEKFFYGVFHIHFTEISIMIALIAILIILFYTAQFNNELILSTISTICIVILRITAPINRIQSAIFTMNSTKKNISDVLEFYENFEKNISYKTTQEQLPFKKSIELKNIGFSYNNNNNNGLKDINLKINKGDFIGIVGKSGCYKTTLSLIISGLIKPTEGEILIDDNILTKENYQKWQNNISLLSQDFSILFENTDEIPKDYKDKLNLNDINQDVNKLSHGEKQRIALANILSQQKDILILDEISSSQDVLVEEKINNTLKDLNQNNKTIISIAHRLHILKHCNKIIYMDMGKILDIDTFSNLYEKHSDFKEIVDLSNFEIN